MRWMSVALEFFLPAICRSCGSRIFPDDPGPVCFSCRQELVLLDPRYDQLCLICGRPQAQPDADGRCKSCLPPGPLQRVLSATVYGGIAALAIERLKYGARTEYAPWIAQWMIPSLNLLDPSAEGRLLAIPLHRARLKNRGFNQAELLAQHLAKATGRQLLPSVILRQRNTPSQTRLTKKKRLENMREAFSCDPQNHPLAGSTIILIDDVATSGATLQAAALALQPLSPGKILALTACRAAPIYDAG